MTISGRPLAFSAYCLLFATSLTLLAEFLLLPAISGLPRDTLLMRFAATPGGTIDNQTINAMGFTGDTVNHPKPDNTLRVLVLGSSTMFNRHLGERLKASLQAHSLQPIELLNASLRSHTSRSDWLKYQFLKKYDFDYLIYYNGINDLWANHTTTDIYRHDYSHMSAWYSEGWLINNSVLARAGYIITRPWLEKIDAALGTHRYNHSAFVFPKKHHQNLAGFASIDSYQQNLQNIISDAHASGTQVLLSTFAYAIPEHYTRRDFLDDTLGYINPDNYDKRDVFNWGEPDYVREGLDRINTTVRHIAANTGAPLLDADAMLSGKITLFGDPCHFNDEGVDMIVTLITQAFIDQGWITPDASRQ